MVNGCRPSDSDYRLQITDQITTSDCRRQTGQRHTHPDPCTSGSHVRNYRTRSGEETRNTKSGAHAKRILFLPGVGGSRNGARGEEVEIQSPPLCAGGSGFQSALEMHHCAAGVRETNESDAQHDIRAMRAVVSVRRTVVSARRRCVIRRVVGHGELALP